WKLDEKIGNFELISKILISVYTGFAFLSFLCVGVFVGANSRSLDFAIGGGLTAMFIFGAIGCIVVWLLPVILKSTGKNKSKKTVTGDSVEFESEASLEPSQANVNKDAKKVSAKKVVTADADVEKENEEEIVLEAEVDEVKSAPVKKAAAKESVAVKEVEKATDEDVEKPVKKAIEKDVEKPVTKAIEKKSATKSEADVEKAEK
ncbi:MAG: hypothetical protein PHE93_01975, partial [Clostridia bacterium]|nr:hypothetical protein [Clostridia bacterium]